MTCPSGLEGAGRRRAPAMVQRAALRPYAKDVLYTGGNLAEVRDHLGHKDIKTTEIYACWAVGERHRLHEEHTVVAEEARRRRERATG